jgi:cellulose biosynthesis protein BcsQ
MILGFLNLKGGVGKSKLNAYFSNYLAHKGHKVLLIDCDVNQHTTEIYHNVINNENFNVINYDFSYGNVAEFILDQEDGYDYVLVDIPGTVQQDGVLSIVGIMDKIIIPTTNEDEDIHSSYKFISFIKEVSEKLGKEIEYRVLLNNYETQFFNMGDEEKGEFPEFRAIFGDNLFRKGIRKERSLLQKNFALGQYGDHKNTKKVEVALDEIFEFLNN